MLKKAVELNNNDYSIYHWLGCDYFENKDFINAEKCSKNLLN